MKRIQEWILRFMEGLKAMFIFLYIDLSEDEYTLKNHKYDLAASYHLETSWN